MTTTTTTTTTRATPPTTPTTMTPTTTSTSAMTSAMTLTRTPTRTPTVETRAITSARTVDAPGGDPRGRDSEGPTAPRTGWRGTTVPRADVVPPGQASRGRRPDRRSDRGRRGLAAWAGRRTGSEVPTAASSAPHPGRRVRRAVRGLRAAGDAGMATAEYAIATVAAAGFALLLGLVLRSDEVRALLVGIVRGALST
jgi:hypothetical protein